MSDWRALFGSEEAARRYLATIRNPARRAATATQLGLVDAIRRAAPETRPPTSPVQDAPQQASAGGLHLTLPFPPSLNSIWRSDIVHIAGEPRIRVRLSARARTYRQAVVQACADQGHPTAPTGRLIVIIDVHAPDHRTRDLDNLNKGLMDALTHAGLWADDSLIDELHLYRRANRPGGAIVMHVAALEPT